MSEQAHLNLEGIARCPSCKAEHIEPQGNYCTWCAYDFRPHHIVLSCCGYRSLDKPDGGCPVCGTEIK